MISHGVNRASWFAGYMDQSEARSVLRTQPEGTFLVRFSATLIDEGGFALEVALKDDEPISFHIEVGILYQRALALLYCGLIIGCLLQSQPERGLLYFQEGDQKDEEFLSLVDLIDRLKTVEISRDCPMLLGPCPNLPFSSETAGYRPSRK